MIQVVVRERVGCRVVSEKSVIADAVVGVDIEVRADGSGDDLAAAVVVGMKFKSNRVLLHCSTLYQIRHDTWVIICRQIGHSRSHH